jgi:hypothetical protein
VHPCTASPASMTRRSSVAHCCLASDPTRRGAFPRPPAHRRARRPQYSSTSSTPTPKGQRTRGAAVALAATPVPGQPPGSIQHFPIRVTSAPTPPSPDAFIAVHRGGTVPELRTNPPQRLLVAHGPTAASFVLPIRGRRGGVKARAAVGRRFMDPEFVGSATERGIRSGPGDDVGCIVTVDASPIAWGVP